MVVITLQSALDTDLTLQAFDQADLRGMLHHHEVGDEWATLGELIDLNERVVLFSNSGAGEDEGYLDQWTHWIDNPYSAQGVDDFSCSVDRGNPETASLFNVNHFITHPVSDIEDSLNANRYDVLWEHLERCQNEQIVFQINFSLISTVKVKSWMWFGLESTKLIRSRMKIQTGVVEKGYFQANTTAIEKRTSLLSISNPPSTKPVDNPQHRHPSL